MSNKKDGTGLNESIEKFLDNPAIKMAEQLRKFDPLATAGLYKTVPTLPPNLSQHIAKVKKFTPLIEQLGVFKEMQAIKHTMGEYLAQAAKTKTLMQSVTPIYKPIELGQAVLPSAYKPIELGQAVLPSAYKPIELGQAVLPNAYKPIEIGQALLSNVYKPIELGQAVLPKAYKPIELGQAVLSKAYKPIELPKPLASDIFKQMATYSAAAQLPKQVKLHTGLLAESQRAFDIGKQFLASGLAQSSELQQQIKKALDSTKLTRLVLGEAFQRYDNSRTIQQIKGLDYIYVVGEISKCITEVEEAEPKNLVEQPPSFQKRFFYSLDFTKWDLEEFKQRIKQFNPTVLSAEFYLGLLLNFMFYQLSLIAANESERKILERIDRLEDVIAMQIETLRQMEQKAHLFVVNSNLNLRKAPGKEHEILTVLSPNQTLNGLQTKGEWMQVEYFDYLKNEMVNGWAHTAHLMPIIRVSD